MQKIVLEPDSVYFVYTAKEILYKHRWWHYARSLIETTKMVETENQTKFQADVYFTKIAATKCLEDVARLPKKRVGFRYVQNLSHFCLF